MLSQSFKIELHRAYWQEGDKTWQYSNYIRPYNWLIYVHSGKGIVEIEGRSRVLQQGRLHLCPLNKISHYSSREEPESVTRICLAADQADQVLFVSCLGLFGLAALVHLGGFTHNEYAVIFSIVAFVMASVALFLKLILRPLMLGYADSLRHQLMEKP